MVLGRLVALTIMFPDRVTPQRDANGFRRYRYVDAFGGVRDFGEDQVFHVKGFGVGGDLGLSPIAFARRNLSVTIAADDAAANAVKNGIRPAGFLTTGKTVLSPEQRDDIRKAVLEPVTGVNGTARAAVLEAGFDWKDAVGIPPEELQLLETRGFHIEELCRWFRIPPPMIGHTSKTTSWPTGLEQQQLLFLTYSLRPYLVRIEQAVKKQLFTAEDKANGVYAEFGLEGLMRADSAGRAALYASAAQNGWMTRNEIRALENLPPVEGGDVITVQVNLTPLADLGQEPTQAGLTALRSALLPWLGHNGGPPLDVAA